eukprot:TRINITY_DN7984_c0_g1_i3.p1 TRINITY_DN7984_c0_g1~~TRINITY_DN7984_c0_g1_i3.p1  ORF type:complete len:315 (+),score=57.00 TRINITY_DN7984_c0_g1_i3:72-1016(+)
MSLARFFPLLRVASRRKLAAASSITSLSIALFSTQKERPVPLKFHLAHSLRPHPDKQAKGGEDAFFLDKKLNAFGVADGVGGWNEVNVDPAAFSRQLMKFAAECVTTTMTKQTNTDTHIDPKQILEEAWQQTTAIGSSTALLGFLQPRSHLFSFANLGDSGLIILRPQQNGSYDIVLRTKEQQHQFNCPYQLSSLATKQAYRGTLFDHPNKADSQTLPLQPRDIVIAATDGLFDNIFDKQIVEIVQKIVSSQPQLDQDQCAQQIADLLSVEAHRVGRQTVGTSPFAVNAMRYRYRFVGGKLDDVCVVVALTGQS